MEKIIGILIVLFVVGTTMQSCSEDSKEGGKLSPKKLIRWSNWKC